MTAQEIVRSLGPVCIDLEGTTLTEREEELLKHPLVGMVILFTRNYTSRDQLADLTAAIHERRPGIVIAVDHEGGRVQRFREGFTQIPSMRELATGPNVAARYRAAGVVLAHELRMAGVDMTFAPVLDVDYGRSGVIGDRSLGTTPALVTNHARSLIDGLAEAGMAACGKHFPGHGWAEADSHTTLPRDERPAEKVLRDAEPYRLLTGLPAVMTAHVAYDAFQGEIATFSSGLLKDVLRQKFGFTGLVFSDDLTMKGAGEGPIEERAARALAAGCDVLLACNHPAEMDRLLEYLVWERNDAFHSRFMKILPGEDLVTPTRYEDALGLLPTAAAA